MNNHHSTGTESQQPNTQPEKQEKRPWFNQGWVWLIVAAFGIGLIYMGLSDITAQLTNVSHSIQENTDAVKAQSHILSGIKQNIQQLIFTIKDAVNQIRQSI